jgi:hypothetical protein
MTMIYILEQHRDRTSNVIVYENVYESHVKALAKWTTETQKRNNQADDDKLRFVVEISKGMARAFLKERGKKLI